MVVGLAAGAAGAPEPGKASGAITIDGVTTTMSHAVRVSKTNVFDALATDPVIVVSNVPLTTAEAGDETGLLARAQRGEIVTMAFRYDGRRGRGQLFNVTLAHRGLDELALLPDVLFTHSFKAGAGTARIDAPSFRGYSYKGSVEFAVVMPVETTDAAPVVSPLGPLPFPSKTDADRRAASALLIQALQEGDEARALAIVALGVDPDARDEKMKIPLVNWAVLMCQPLIVKALVEAKANITFERLPGMTLLGEAQAACPEAVPFLKGGGP
jgi:hypothetical protein